MGWLQLAFVVGLIGGGWFMVNSFLNGYEKKGAERQMAADAIVLEAVKKDRDVAVKANVQLRHDVETNQAETDACNTKVDDLKRHGLVAADAKKDALKKAESRISSLNGHIAEIESALAASKLKPEVSCEKALGKAGSVILPTAADRLRSPSPTSSSGGQRSPPPAATDPSANPVRRSP